MLRPDGQMFLECCRSKIQDKQSNSDTSSLSVRLIYFIRTKGSCAAVAEERGQTYDSDRSDCAFS
jgi:hypothetical protein